MQQPGPLYTVTTSFPSTNITTDQIQKCLDENKKLILAILDNQNLGKFTEYAQYQAQLQKNLMYLAAIADAQPQALSPIPPPHMTPHNAMQQGGLYIPHPQAAAMSQQPVILTQRAPFGIPHPLQDPRHQLPQQVLHQQSTQGLMAMWPVGATSGMRNNANLGGVNNILPALNPANKQDKPESSVRPKSDGQGRSSNVSGSADGDKAN